jgi:16S rRNA (cytosine967-C5)-methyltransferase
VSSAAPARTASFVALRHISADGATLGDALARAKSRLGDERDRALVNEIVTGTLRHRLALDYQLASRIARRYSSLDDDVLIVLRLSAFQLLYLTRVPAGAVVNDAVSLARTARKSSATGLVNAVLRRLARDRNALTWPTRPTAVISDADRAQLVEHLATVYSHPAWLVERWLERYGAVATEQWLTFDNQAPALTLATNLARVTREELAALLAAEGIETTPTQVASRGLILRSGNAISSSPFRQGLCVVQDEASQLVADIVPAQLGDRVLDACASPGGKTVALAAAVGRRGLVVATDVRARRVQTLRDTIHRCGIENARIVHIGTEGAFPFVAGAFDRVLVDAPCSGLGTLRRDPDIRWRRGPDELVAFADAQLAILERVASLVAHGGHLVYSTCSSEPDENEAVVRRFLDRNVEFVAAAADLRTLPFRDGLEAFFAATLLRRTPPS